MGAPDYSTELSSRNLDIVREGAYRKGREEEMGIPGRGNGM